MKRLLSLFTPKKSTTPTVRSYGQEVSGVSPEVIQQTIEWLALSLIQARYSAKAHLFWLDAEDDLDVMKALQQVTCKQEPVFLYRCSEHFVERSYRTFTPLDRYYWCMVTEHPSMRVYQLEWREED